MSSLESFQKLSLTIALAVVVIKKKTTHLKDTASASQKLGNVSDICVDLVQSIYQNQYTHLLSSTLHLKFDLWLVEMEIGPTAEKSVEKLLDPIPSKQDLELFQEHLRTNIIKRCIKAIHDDNLSHSYLRIIDALTLICVSGEKSCITELECRFRMAVLSATHNSILSICEEHHALPHIVNNNEEYLMILCRLLHEGLVTLLHYVTVTSQDHTIMNGPIEPIYISSHHPLHYERPIVSFEWIEKLILEGHMKTVSFPWITSVYDTILESLSH